MRPSMVGWLRGLRPMSDELLEGNRPPDAFELKLAFLRELETAYRGAREAQDRLLSSKGDAKALLELKNFFHRIAGTAHVVDFAELAYLCAICERNAELIEEGALPVEKIVTAFGDGLAAVAHVLDAHGAGKVDRPLPRPGPVAAAGLLQPTQGEERGLSTTLAIDDDPCSPNLIDAC